MFDLQEAILVNPKCVNHFKYVCIQNDPIQSQGSRS